ncbi:TetR/AcrR family transcriptional regulator [Streptomyces boluensis]|uniref:TetR family transcriptional regulator n=1 Tax=Streptomyces boluensis TaxID=1775135 RepID=A0A964XQU2_9ACTN|nr:TetR/AcrR family transcriptional regulator [Streptomyces boluensis]NBE56152.1 TetR family transcriptional regulator [Streptomyces boluensis]
MSPKDGQDGQDQWHEDGEGAAAAPKAAPRGRPRSEAVERAIIEGVLSLLEQGDSLADLSIERIARTAGVGKATIYRRWKGKEELFVDVMWAMDEPEAPLPGTSVRDDLVVILGMMRRRGLAKRTSALLQGLLAQAKSYPRLWELYHRNVVDLRRRRTAEVLRRGVDSGELRADLDPDLMVDLITGPMLARTVLRPDAELPEGLAETVVDAVLDGLRRPAPERARDGRATSP